MPGALTYEDFCRPLSPKSLSSRADDERMCVYVRRSPYGLNQVRLQKNPLAADLLFRYA